MDNPGRSIASRLAEVDGEVLRAFGPRVAHALHQMPRARYRALRWVVQSLDDDWRDLTDPRWNEGFRLACHLGLASIDRDGRPCALPGTKVWRDLLWRRDDLIWERGTARTAARIDRVIARREADWERQQAEVDHV